MSQFVDVGHKAFTAGAAIARYLRVKLSSGKLAAAGLTDYELGVLRDASFADGDVRDVVLRTKPGRVIMVANAAIPAGVLVYTAASGKISPTNATGSILIGRALEAATADGDLIE